MGKLKQKRTGLTTQHLTVVGLLMAMDIILTRFVAIQTPFTRITFGFLPSAVMGALYGPWIAGTAGALTDLIGIFLFNRGAPFFIGFTVSAFLGSAIYGLFLHRKQNNLFSIIAAVLVISIFVNILLNTVWLVMIYGEAWRVILPARILQNAIIAPVRVILIHFVLNQRTLKKLFQKNSTATR